MLSPLKVTYRDRTLMQKCFSSDGVCNEYLVEYECMYVCKFVCVCLCAAGGRRRLSLNPLSALKSIRERAVDALALGGPVAGLAPKVSSRLLAR
jgi:hypothetical protein